MIEVVQAYDRLPITRIDSDDADALEHKLATAYGLFRDRKGWLEPHQRIAVLRKLAELMAERRDMLALQIAREGGKPLADALIESKRIVRSTASAILRRCCAPAQALRSRWDLRLPASAAAPGRSRNPSGLWRPSRLSIIH